MTKLTNRVQEILTEKLYSFQNAPKAEEKGYCLVHFQEPGTNCTRIKYTAHNLMQDFCLPRHYEYRCGKVGNNVSYSKIYHVVFFLKTFSSPLVLSLQLNNTFLAPLM